MTIKSRWRPPADPVAEAAADAARLQADVEHRRQLAQLARETRAADADATRAERAARTEDARQRRTAAQEARRQDRAARQARRTNHAAVILALAGRLRLVAPLMIVTGFAVFGQIAYGLEHYSPADWPPVFRVLVAVGAAIAVESIALYVQWHAHDALLMGATATAARLRRASYGIALAVAGVNYAHFANGWNHPTAAAVVFALFSASSPWLWGLHTRRAQHIQLIREGHVDSPGAVFSAERARAFPIRTWQARRWSIDHGVSDPREAWEGYNRERAARLAGRGTLLPRRAGLRWPVRHARTAPAPGSAGWITAPTGATSLPIVAQPVARRPERHGHAAPVPKSSSPAALPSSLRTAVPDGAVEPLPEVPPIQVRDTLSAPALRERAQQTYRLARARGQRVTGAVLGEAYGRGERWGRQQIEEVECEKASTAVPQQEVSP